MSRNNGFGTAEAESEKMAECGFETLNEIKIVKTHRKPRRSKFHLFSSFSKLWKYFE